MRVPNAERAVVDLRKLTDYCLDLTNEVGAHKARVFASALGFTKQDAFRLHSELRTAILESEAILGRADHFGQRYIVDFDCTSGDRNARIRSVWIIDAGSDFPRLITCFVL